MDRKRDVATSKLISLALRHDPASIGIALDDAGWVALDELFAALARHGHSITREDLERISASADKQRFAFSDDGMSIRAHHGHSVEVELGYKPQTPPEFLFHGTAEQNVESILREGINPGARQHVHLSADTFNAHRVGQRHGKPVVLRLRTGEMQRAGHAFFLSGSGIWLTPAVPPEFIERP